MPFGERCGRCGGHYHGSSACSQVTIGPVSITGGNVARCYRCTPVSDAFVMNVGLCARHAAELEAALRGRRKDDAFTVEFVVRLDVPDPDHTGNGGVVPHDEDRLAKWLRGLVMNAPPKGVYPEVRRA